MFHSADPPARFAGRARQLRFESVIRLDHSPSNALGFRIEDYAEKYPFTYGSDEMPDLLRSIEGDPYTVGSPLAILLARKR